MAIWVVCARVGRTERQGREERTGAGASDDKRGEGVVRTHLSTLLLCGTVLLPVSMARAQEAVASDAVPAAQMAPADDAEGEGGDIVVTALRRETSLQRTPLAISAVSGDTLTRMGIGDTSALARVAPGMVVRESGLSGSRITIRNIRAAGEPTVGLYYDDVPLMGSAGVNSDAGGTLPAIRLFDVERVEVLRGPQGTLYGSSSMAGAVRLVFAKPDLTDYAGNFSGEMSSVAHGGLGFETQGMVNAPIVRDMVGLRVVGFIKEQPGYVDNIRLGRNDINNQHSWGGRALLRVEPADGVTVDLMANVQKLTGSLNDYTLAAGAYNSTYESLQPLIDRNEIYTGTLKWKIGGVELTLIGSHAYRDFNYSFDFSDFFRTVASRFAVGSAAYTLYNNQAPSVANSSQITKTDTAEARLASDGDGPIDWTIGGFYADRKGDIASNIVRTGTMSGRILRIDDNTLLGQRVVTDGLRQVAGFGEATWHVTPSLALTGGLRYYDYTRRVTSEVTKVNASVGFSTFPLTRYRTSEHGLLYKANASYEFSPQAMAYATFSTGQRPGGINQTVGLPADLVSYKSDSLNNYELGAKTRLLGRALTLNGALFQIDWNDMQTSGSLPGTNFAFIANAGRARARGIEVEATLVPFAGLEMQASGSYIDAKLREDQTNQALTASGLKGDPIPFVPNVTVQGNAQYEWAAGRDLRATLRADLSYGGPSWTEFRHTSATQRRLPAYTTVDVRASISGIEDHWNVALFVRNLLDADTVVTKLSGNVYGSLDNVRAISLTPRTIGLSFTKSF